MIALKTLLPESKKETPFGACCWNRLPVAMYSCQVGHSAETAVAVGRQAGLLEQVAAVADGQAADVGAEADLAAVRRDRLPPLPGQPLLCRLLAPVLPQVDELRSAVT